MQRASPLTHFALISAFFERVPALRRFSSEKLLLLQGELQASTPILAMLAGRAFFRERYMSCAGRAPGEFPLNIRGRQADGIEEVCGNL